MIINVKAKPAARENKIEKLDDTHFIVSVKEPPREGRANKAIIELLAEYFKVSVSEVRIINGHNSRQKIVGILN